MNSLIKRVSKLGKSESETNVKPVGKKCFNGICLRHSPLTEKPTIVVRADKKAAKSVDFNSLFLRPPSKQN